MKLIYRKNQMYTKKNTVTLSSCYEITLNEITFIYVTMMKHLTRLSSKHFFFIKYSVNYKFVGRNFHKNSLPYSVPPIFA